MRRLHQPAHDPVERPMTAHHDLVAWSPDQTLASVRVGLVCHGPILPAHGVGYPHLRLTHERFIVASRAEYGLPGMLTAWDIDGYLSVLTDVWRLPLGRARRGQPLAFPDELVRRLVLLYSCTGDVVLDPFAGIGTVGRVARQHDRRARLIEREPSYWPLIEAAVGMREAT